MDFTLVLLAVALGLLYVGGEVLVAGAVSTANRLRLPPFLIGLTIVGFGTSMPELVVSLDAAFVGAYDISLGNVIGSNTANILLILGAAAVISPIVLDGEKLTRDLAVMLAAAAALLGFGWFGEIGRWAGGGLVALLALYLVWAAVSGRGEENPSMETRRVLPLWREVAAILTGLLFLVWGGDLLVSSATGIARDLGVPEAIIGLTVVAVGTSLPELATSIVAALRRQSGIAVGNVIGSNIFNIAGILGVTALIVPLPVAQGFVADDIPVMIAVSLALAAILLLRHGISRLTGLVLLGSYAAYVALIV